MADQLRQQADRGPYPPPLLRSLDPGTVSVGISTRVGPDERSILVLHEDFAVSRDEEPSVFVRVQWALKSEVFRAQDPVIRGEYGTHIAVWFSPEERRLNTLRKELEEPLERLGKKLKHKVAQTKLGPDWRRLLVVQTWIVDELERASEEDLRRFRRRIFEEHSGMAGILLVRRHWNQQLQRSVYVTRLLVPETSDPAFGDWMERVLMSARTVGYP
jgi:hypothetical protein